MYRYYVGTCLPYDNLTESMSLKRLSWRRFENLFTRLTSLFQFAMPVMRLADSILVAPVLDHFKFVELELQK